MSIKTVKLIALCGYARSGKDSFSSYFLDQASEYTRFNFGDIIKDFFDNFLARRITMNQLEAEMSQVLSSEKSEEDLKEFLSKYAEPYEKAMHSISAFSEDNVDKEIIRPILEHGGEVIYDWVSSTYFRSLDEYVAQGRSVVNTRLCRLPEAEEWKRRGGIIVYIDRLNHPPATDWDKKMVDDLLSNSHVALSVINDSTDSSDWNSQSRKFAEYLEESYDDIKYHFEKYGSRLVMKR